MLHTFFKDYRYLKQRSIAISVGVPAEFIKRRWLKQALNGGRNSLEAYTESLPVSTFVCVHPCVLPCYTGLGLISQGEAGRGGPGRAPSIKDDHQEGADHH